MELDEDDARIEAKKKAILERYRQIQQIDPNLTLSEADIEERKRKRKITNNSQTSLGQIQANIQRKRNRLTNYINPLPPYRINTEFYKTSHILPQRNNNPPTPIIEEQRTEPIKKITTQQLNNLSSVPTPLIELKPVQESQPKEGGSSPILEELTKNKQFLVKKSEKKQIPNFQKEQTKGLFLMKQVPVDNSKKQIAQQLHSNTQENKGGLFSQTGEIKQQELKATKLIFGGGIPQLQNKLQNKSDLQSTTAFSSQAAQLENQTKPTKSGTQNIFSNIPEKTEPISQKVEPLFGTKQEKTANNNSNLFGSGNSGSLFNKKQEPFSVNLFGNKTQDPSKGKKEEQKTANLFSNKEEPPKNNNNNLFGNTSNIFVAKKEQPTITNNNDGLFGNKEEKGVPQLFGSTNNLFGASKKEEKTGNNLFGSKEATKDNTIFAKKDEKPSFFKTDEKPSFFKTDEKPLILGKKEETSSQGIFGGNNNKQETTETVKNIEQTTTPGGLFGDFKPKSTKKNSEQKKDIFNSNNPTSSGLFSNTQPSKPETNLSSVPSGNLFSSSSQPVTTSIFGNTMFNSNKLTETVPEKKEEQKQEEKKQSPVVIVAEEKEEKREESFKISPQKKGEGIGPGGQKIELPTPGLFFSGNSSQKVTFGNNNSSLPNKKQGLFGGEPAPDNISQSFQNKAAGGLFPAGTTNSLFGNNTQQLQTSQSLFGNNESKPQVATQPTSLGQSIFGSGIPSGQSLFGGTTGGSLFGGLQGGENKGTIFGGQSQGNKGTLFGGGSSMFPTPSSGPKGQSEEEGEEEDENGLVKAKDDADPSKSTFNFEYQKSQVYFKEQILKFRQDGQSLIENVTLSLERYPGVKYPNVFIRGSNKCISFDANVVAGVTKARKLNESSQNIEVSKMMVVKNGETKFVRAKIAFKDQALGQKFLDELQKLQQSSD